MPLDTVERVVEGTEMTVAERVLEIRLVLTPVPGIVTSGTPATPPHDSVYAVKNVSIYEKDKRGIKKTDCQ